MLLWALGKNHFLERRLRCCSALGRSWAEEETEAMCSVGRLGLVIQSTFNESEQKPCGLFYDCVLELPLEGFWGKQALICSMGFDFEFVALI